MALPKRAPKDALKAFGYFVSKCADGLCREKMTEEGYTATQARNLVIHLLLSFASGEACRIAREEGREPDILKWKAATEKAFNEAVERTKDSRTPATMVVAAIT